MRNESVNRPVTVGLIVGNRGFFPSELCSKGRVEMLEVLRAAGFEVVVLGPEETEYGSVESLDDVATESFASHQTNDKVTMGVDPYVMGDKIKVAFGKVDPYQYGVLPVLVAIQNDSNVSIKLDGLHAEYVGPNGDRVDATPAHDVRYAVGTAAERDGWPGRGGVQGFREEKSAGRVGDRRPRVFGADAAAGAVGQRVSVF